MAVKKYVGWTDRDTAKKGYADLDTRFSSYNTKAEALIGDSVVDDRAALNTLVNVTMQPNGGTLDVVGAVRIGSDMTIPSNVKLNFLASAYLAPDIGVTVTHGGRISYPCFEKIFGGGGTVTFNATTRVGKVRPEWWGAVGDGVALDSAPIIAAATAIPAAGGKLAGRPGSTYRIAAAITLAARSNIAIDLPAGCSIAQDTIDTPALIFDACTNMSIEGAGEIYCTQALPAVAPAYYGGVEIRNGCVDFRIRGIKVRNFSSVGIVAGHAGYTTCRGIELEGVRATRNRGAGLFVEDANVTVRGGEYSRNGRIVARTGTISAALNSTTVVGVGTLFLTEYAVNQRIVDDLSGQVRTITAIATDLSMTVRWAWDQAIPAGSAHTRMASVDDFGTGYGIAVTSNATLAASLAVVGAQLFGNVRKGIDAHFGRRVVVSACFIHDNAQWGADLGPNLGAVPPEITEWLISANQIYHNGFDGIRFTPIEQVIPVAAPTKVTTIIVGNLIYENNLGIQVVAGRNIVINANIIRNNISYGIFLGNARAPNPTAQVVTIKANQVLDNGDIGIYVRNGNADITIGGNNVHWTTDSTFAAPVNMIAVESDCLNVIVASDNTVSGATGIQILHGSATVLYSAAMTPDVSFGASLITATNGVAFAINAPTSPLVNREWELTIKNTSGGALGVATFNAVFKMGAAWVQPATGFNRAVRFRYDGTNWIEKARSAADVAN